MTTSYRPGSWCGILGPELTVLLPPTERWRMAGLWHRVDDGADVDEVLDALLSDGLRALPGLLLISRSGDTTRVLLRGRVRASFALAGGESAELDGASATTWAERTLTGVTSTQVVVDEGAEPESTVAFDPLGDDHDGLTRTGGWDPQQFARQQPGIPGQPSAPGVTARPVAVLAFSSGEAVEVDRVVLVGRAPTARGSSAEQPHLLRVPSPQQEISSTHLEIRPGSGADHGSAVVTDLGSTNGTVLVQPGLAPEDLRPGVPVQLVPGAVVDLGDGVTISVGTP